MSTWIIGDVHGCYNALMKLLDILHLSQEDTVYFVGDFVDRDFDTEQMLNLYRWILNNITQDGQFRSVIGNHELDWVLNKSYNLYKLDKAAKDIDYDKLVNILRKLPVSYEVEVDGFKNIITHSWLVERSHGGISIEDSVWDRTYSLYEDPKNFRVIHGHTIVSSRCMNHTDNKFTLNKIIKINDNNIDIDCGCFLGLHCGGNLAAYCIELDKVVYAYTQDDMIEYTESICEEYSLNPASLLLASSMLPPKVFFSLKDDKIVQYVINNFSLELGVNVDSINDNLSVQKVVAQSITDVKFAMDSLSPSDRRLRYWR